MLHRESTRAALLEGRRATEAWAISARPKLHAPWHGELLADLRELPRLAHKTGSRSPELLSCQSCEMRNVANVLGGAEACYKSFIVRPQRQSRGLEGPRHGGFSEGVLSRPPGLRADRSSDSQESVLEDPFGFWVLLSESTLAHAVHI